MWLTGSMYALGAAIGLGVGQSRLQATPHWPVAIRLQILVAACLLGVVAAWRLHAARQLEVPFGIEIVLVCVLVAALLTRGSSSRGEAALWSWAATANSSFWAIPLSTAIAGAEGAVLAVLADRVSVARTAYVTHLLRADAPHPQRMRTAWIDQAPMGALVIGLLLHFAGSAPHWTASVARYIGPWLALTGAMLFTASLSHDSTRDIPVTRMDVERVVALFGLRMALAVPLLMWRWGSAGAAVVALNAFSVPAFLPAQMSVLYGYRSGVVRAAATWGWVVGPAGLVLGVAAR
jgi:hypothetical protein